MKIWMIAILAAGVLTALGGFLIRDYGRAQYNAGRFAAIAEVNLAAVERARKDEVKKYEVHQLSDDDLVRRYCRFVYGDTYDVCVRTVKPVD